MNVCYILVGVYNKTEKKTPNNNNTLLHLFKTQIKQLPGSQAWGSRFNTTLVPQLQVSLAVHVFSIAERPLGAILEENGISPWFRVTILL